MPVSATAILPAPATVTAAATNLLNPRFPRSIRPSPCVPPREHRPPLQIAPSPRLQPCKGPIRQSPRGTGTPACVHRGSYHFRGNALPLLAFFFSAPNFPFLPFPRQAINGSRTHGPFQYRMPGTGDANASSSESLLAFSLKEPVLSVPAKAHRPPTGVIP